MRTLQGHTNINSQTLGRGRRLWFAILLGSLSAFGPLSLDMYLPSLPILSEDLKASTSLTQLSLTACLLGLALGQLLAGPISDVRGRRMPLLAGLALYSASSLLCMAAPNIGIFVVLRFLQGVAGAAGIVISRAIVRDLYEGKELTKFYTLLMLINGSAPILAPILGASLLQVTSWRGVFLVLAGIGALMLLGVIVGLHETLPAVRRSKGGLRNMLSTFRILLRDRLFVGYALSQGLVMGAMFAYISGSPFVLQGLYGVSPQLFSFIFGMNGLGIIFAGQLTGRLVNRFSEGTLFLTGIGIAALGGFGLLAVLLAGGGLALILLCLFLVVASVGIVTTTGFSLAMQNYGQAAGSASALLGVLTYLFGGVVAPLVGLGGEGTALPMGLVIAGAELGAVLCYMALVGQRGEQKQ
ncbi:multidrug effflux MFS transporter [Paenibacillus sp. GCM10023252]|uniref:multidrug effflux MFS transporter n=1 Tax=Paenibacillus sp. GCM10023252 TaxID=3252649 RepID=UPI00361609A1